MVARIANRRSSNNDNCQKFDPVKQSHRGDRAYRGRPTDFPLEIESTVGPTAKSCDASRPTTHNIHQMRIKLEIEMESSQDRRNIDPKIDA